MLRDIYRKAAMIIINFELNLLKLQKNSTVKFLVCVIPNEVISYFSKCWGRGGEGESH